MHSLRIYLIGAGVIARIHASAIRTLPQHEQVLLAVADPDPQALKAFTDAYPHSQTFSDAREMLAEPANERDIVIIATPPFTHYELTCMALATGRHVLCEKPLAMNMTEATQMLQKARAEKRILGCCSTRALGSPVAQEIQRILQSEQLGPIYHWRYAECFHYSRAGIEIQPETPWFLNRARAGGGVLMNLGPYDFAFLHDILRPVHVDVLAAWMENPQLGMPQDKSLVIDVEHHIGATLRYRRADDSVVIGNYERAASTYSEQYIAMELVGLRGTVRWYWSFWESKGYVTHIFEEQGKLEERTLQFEDTGAVKTMEKPLYYFYHLLNAEKPVPAIVNEQALFNFACIQAVYDCVRSGTMQSVSLQADEIIPTGAV